MIGTQQVLVICLAVVVSSAPIEHDVGHIDMSSSAVSFLDFGPVNDNITVSCPLCITAMTSLLDFCKEFDGFSVPRISDYVSKCSLIGEKELRLQDREEGCTNQTIILRSRARVWNRKLKCLKIYTALSEAYSPFDPCTQIRLVVEKAPSAPCHANPIRCVNEAPHEYVGIPPWAKNASLPNENPPLTCPQYAARMESKCQLMKSKDFYARSNLEDFCAAEFAGHAHQISGCETVRNLMVAQDYMMDLCGSLHAVPIHSSYEVYCEQTLRLPVHDFVPDAGFAAYLERVKIFKEAWTIPEMHEAPSPSAPTQFPLGDVVVNPPATPEPPKSIPVQQE